MIHIYATTKDGDGHSAELDRIEGIDGYELRIGVFAPDVLITFEERNDSKEDEPAKELKSVCCDKRAIPSGDRFVCAVESRGVESGVRLIKSIS